MAYIQPCASCGASIESDHSSLPASAVCRTCKGGEKPRTRVQEMLERIQKLPIEDQLSILQALIDSLDVPEP